jgi:hypothetical protein
MPKVSSSIHSGLMRKCRHHGKTREIHLGAKIGIALDRSCAGSCILKAKSEPWQLSTHACAVHTQSRNHNSLVNVFQSVPAAHPSLPYSPFSDHNAWLGSATCLLFASISGPEFVPCFSEFSWAYMAGSRTTVFTVDLAIQESLGCDPAPAGVTWEHSSSGAISFGISQAEVWSSSIHGVRRREALWRRRRRWKC